MAALLPGLDLREAVARVRCASAAFVPRALTETCCEQLRREISGVASFESAHGSYGRRQVRQECDVFVTADFGPYPELERLRDELAARVHAAAGDVAGLARWRPDEVSIQRYHPAPVGITPHLDHKRYRYLVVLATVVGEAAFTLCRNREDREGAAIARWNAAPGSLVLLRGPGFDNLDDGRPLHAVAAPARGTRISLGFRMDALRGGSEPAGDTVPPPASNPGG
jgi:alkylated DNA repair dioxygenase AlkB